MKHPLENPTLAPVNLVTAFRQKRIREKLGGARINGEKIILRLWSKRNCLKSEHPLPIEYIVHHILPSQKQSNRILHGDFFFEGKPYQTRDIIVLSSVICWLGTNCGQSFYKSPLYESDGTVFETSLLKVKKVPPLREFILKFKYENGRPGYRQDLVAFWLHESGNYNREQLHGINMPSERDRAVAYGLMWWLGTQQGRVFMQIFRAKIQSIFNSWVKTTAPHVSHVSM